MRAGFLRLDIGCATSSDAPAEYVNFCERTLSNLFGDVALIGDSIPRLSLPFSIEQIIYSGSIVYHNTIQNLKEWIHDTDIVIIDVNEHRDVLVPGKAEIHLATALTFLHNNETQDKEVEFVILRRNIPSPRDAVISALKELENANRLTIISDEGEIYPKTRRSNFSADEYKLARLSIKGNPLDLLKAKMIRRRGHFHNNAGGLQTYFFDGDKCDSQLFDLICGFVANECADPSLSSIFYHCTVSTWLAGPVIAVGNRLSLPIYSAKDFLEGAIIPDARHMSNVLLIVPRIESGRTIEQLVQSLSNSGNLNKLTILAIISTQADERDQRNIRIGATVYEVHYFLKDERSPQFLSGSTSNCPLCVTDNKIRVSDFRNEEFATLTTFAFHTMAIEASWGPEDNVPPTREPIRSVPNVVQMLKQDGAFLASKMLGLLRYHVGEDFPTKPFVIVHPDQRGATAIASNMKFLHDSVTLIQIPDHELDRQRLQPHSKPSDENAKWCTLLNSAAPSQAVVLMEKFVRGSSTKSAMAALVSYFGRRVSCHVVLADFSIMPLDSEQIPTFSLYRIPLDKH